MDTHIHDINITEFLPKLLRQIFTAVTLLSVYIICYSEKQSLLYLGFSVLDFLLLRYTVPTSSGDGSTVTRLSLNCTQKALPKAVAITEAHDDIKPTTEILALAKVRMPFSSDDYQPNLEELCLGFFFFCFFSCVLLSSNLLSIVVDPNLKLYCDVLFMALFFHGIGVP